jgi:hypothetical protein
MGAAHVAVLFDGQTRFERFFVFMGAVSNAFALFALHFDGVILGHT